MLGGTFVLVLPSFGCFQGDPIPHPYSPVEVARVSTTSTTPSINVANSETIARMREVKKSKCIKVRNKGSQLILSEGLTMADVINTANRVLVG